MYNMYNVIQYIQLPKSELQQQQLIVHAGAQAFRGVGWLFCVSWASWVATLVLIIRDNLPALFEITWLFSVAAMTLWLGSLAASGN